MYCLVRLIWFPPASTLGVGSCNTDARGFYCSAALQALQRGFVLKVPPSHHNSSSKGFSKRNQSGNVLTDVQEADRWLCPALLRH